MSNLSMGSYYWDMLGSLGLGLTEDEKAQITEFIGRMNSHLGTYWELGLDNLTCFALAGA